MLTPASSPHISRLDAIRIAWVEADDIEPELVTAQADMRYLIEQLESVSASNAAAATLAGEFSVRVKVLEEQLEVMTAQRNVLHMAASSVYAALYTEEYARARRQLEDVLEAVSFPASRPPADATPFDKPKMQQVGVSLPAISPPETCDLCNGTGKRSERYELYHPLAQDCSKCNGTGALSPASRQNS